PVLPASSSWAAWRCGGRGGRGNPKRLRPCNRAPPLPSSSNSTMSSATSTERPAPAAGGVQPSHIYLLAPLVAAPAAVMPARNTHPVALLLLSGTALSAGLIGLALHRSVAAFFGLGHQSTTPPSERAIEVLQREKALVLRSIKELEFDHAMGKVSDADFKD